MGEFDYYELRGVITPGVIVVVAAAILFPGLSAFGGENDFSLGDVGILLILSYVTGHLVAAIANLLEEPYWRARGGWPTSWLAKPDRKLLGAAQHAGIVARLQDLGHRDLGTLDQRDWKGVNREMYARISREAGATRLIDVFNSNYGMFRGIATSLLIATLLIPASLGVGAWPWSVGIFAVAAVAAYRMDHFAKLYSKELIARYLAID